MKVLTNEEKVKAVQQARALVRSIYGGTFQENKSCLYDAIGLQVLLIAKHGVRTMLQAGTTQWPFRRPEDDDGVCATHFSYRWEIGFSEGLRIFLITGVMPEMHVWLAQRGGVDAPEDTVIDPTAGSWPERAAEDGHPWFTPRPPDFLWATASELTRLSEERFPLGVTYAPDPDACRLAGFLGEQDVYPTVVTELKERLSRARGGDFDGLVAPEGSGEEGGS